jgi:hypothetical protein
MDPEISVKGNFILESHTEYVEYCVNGDDTFRSLKFDPGKKRSVRELQYL